MAWAAYTMAMAAAGTTKEPYDMYAWSADPHALEILNNRAWSRDMRLNPEELEAKNEALRVCILGDRYWLRGHP